ncbi:hypothetical protein ALC62_11311 [Cyphomyrmex costatus]|uniref:Zinc finger FYVE domain-containing protein 19 n=1 Tax=Cyphomyrmex costatus TaxID=456900 RepID=A0A195CB90_9HYME|nr:hypothetical protein ALC62_11311 [Cyphomyrmex costatus]
MTFFNVEYFNRLDLLENPIKPPIVIYKHTNHWDKLKMGLEPADQQIVDRLRKLKDEERNISLPTVEEIKQRLALLKDQNPETSGSNIINVYQIDTRTDQEKAEDLIQEYLAPIELPSTSDLCEDIEMVDSLQNDDNKSYFDQHMKQDIDIYKKLCNTTSSDSTELINKISAMEIKTPRNVEEDNEDEDENENECVMCSRTANDSDLYKCAGCTDDLYCLSCFKDFHDEGEIINNHKPVHFVKEAKLPSVKMNLITKLLTSDSRKNNQ